MLSNFGVSREFQDPLDVLYARGVFIVYWLIES